MKSEFLISNIPVGKLNAVIKNIMAQIGITEPEEAVRMVNAGEVQITVIKTKWTEKDGVILFSVTSDGTTGEAWITRLERKNFSVGDYAKRILLSNSFKPTSGATTEIAVLKGEIFSDNDRTAQNIHKEAKNRKFITPNAEVACLIREKFSDQELEAMGLYWIVAMHEPIKDSGGDPRLLSVLRIDNGSWLHSRYVDPDEKWFRGDGFAFVVSQV